MIGIVVAAHGGLADALVETARLVVRDAGLVVAVGITSDDDAASYETRLQTAVAEAAADGCALVLTDMFGGTPSNIGLSLHDAGRVEVLTGANLPMLIKAIQLCKRETDLSAVAREIKTYGQDAISVASEVLGGASKPANGEATS